MSLVTDVLEQALELLRNGNASLVVIRNGVISDSALGRGVAPLLGLYEAKADALRGAFVVDKVIGKGAAVLLALGEVSRAYGEVVSVAARDYLTARGIDTGYGVLVERIVNRDGTGLCPIEQAVLKVDDPAEGLAKIRETLRELAGQG